MIRYFVWLLLLTVTIPAVSREWHFNWTAPAISPSVYLSSVYGVIYLAVCILIVLAFVLQHSQRRVVFLGFAALLILIQTNTSAIGWDRIALYLTAIALSVVLIEIFRQNIPLYRDLRKNDAVALAHLRRAMVLWSPMILLILLGIYANDKLLDTTEQMVYDTAPIDKYCEVTDPIGAQTIACSGITERLTSDMVSKIPREQAILGHIGLRFAQTTRELLAAVESPEPPAWLGQGRNAINNLGARMNATEILGLQAQPDPLVEALNAALNKDEELKRIDRLIGEKSEAIARIQRELDRLAKQSSANFGLGWTIHTVRTMALKQPSEELSQLRQRRKTRTAAIRQQIEKKEASHPDGKAAALRRLLVKGLNRVRANATRQQLHHMQKGDSEERKNRIMAHVIRSMDRIESQTNQRVQQLTASTEENIVYAALYTTPRCTTMRTNPEITDQNGESSLMNQGEFRCISEFPATGIPLKPVGLRRSTDLSIDRWHTDIETQATHQLREVSRKKYKTAAQAADQAKNLGSAVPQKIYLGRSSCHLLFRPGNCVSNIAKQTTEDAYEELRTDLGTQYNNRVDRNVNSAAESVDSVIIDARGEMLSTLGSSVALMHNSVERIQQTGNLISIFLWLFLVLAIIKSFMYVLATRIFDAKGTAHIDLGSDNAIQGEYISGSSMTISPEFKRPLITRHVLDNQENSMALMPWPLSAPISRILRNVYFVFNKGGHFQHGSGAMSFTRGSGHHIVEWRMKPGEEVVFDYRNFFGASDNIQLKTTISLRLATILLGRIVFHSAVCTNGEGRLILTAKGTVNDEAKTDSTTLDRLIAWSRHTRFRVSSKGTVKSVFLDGYTMVRLRDADRPNGLIVVEAIGEGGRKIAGAMRFVRAMLLPF